MLDTVIQNKINELPENIRRAVENFDWANEVLHIAHDYKIQIDDIDIFQRETLLVIVGLTAAEDFEKNLSEHMEISHELAESLVADANQHIFRPLQKMAFTHTEEDEEDVIDHSELSSAMGEHGIELVDEFEPEPRPQNELQDLADNIFNKEKIVEEKPKEDLLFHQHTDYNEPIKEKDLRGITGHRTDTSILKQVHPNSLLGLQGLENPEKEIKTQTLDLDNFKNLRISKEEKIDASPSQEEQVLASGEFLKHIGKE